MELRALINALMECLAAVGDCKIYFGTPSAAEIFNGCTIRNRFTIDGEEFLIMEGTNTFEEDYRMEE